MTLFGLPVLLFAFLAADPPQDKAELDRLEKDFDANHRRAAPRDRFPVFHDPAMLSAEEAEAKKVVRPRDPVIGVVHNGEAKAYPIPIMGVHEMGNDTIGGLPIAPTW